jgi:chordin
MIPGQCCPSCPGDIALTSFNETTSKNECYFDGDKKMHLAGTKWHPYLPPLGFDLCSLCTCLPDSLEIECRRSVSCPALTCNEEEAYRDNPNDCCKRCPNALPFRSLDSPDQMGDQRESSSASIERRPNDILAAGGQYIF